MLKYIYHEFSMRFVYFRKPSHKGECTGNLKKNHQRMNLMLFYNTPHPKKYLIETNLIICPCFAFVMAGRIPTALFCKGQHCMAEYKPCNFIWDAFLQLSNKSCSNIKCRICCLYTLLEIVIMDHGKQI